MITYNELLTSNIEDFQFLIDLELKSQIELAQQNEVFKITFNSLSGDIFYFTCNVVNEVTETGLYKHLYPILVDKIQTLQIQHI